MSLLYKASPDEELKLILIDPKVVELKIYNSIPVCLASCSRIQKAVMFLNWVVNEMTRRYTLFANFNVRDMKSYNETGVKNYLISLSLLMSCRFDGDSVKEVEDSISGHTAMARADRYPSSICNPKDLLLMF